MPIIPASEPLWETPAQAILLGLNTQGEVAVNPLETKLRDLYPVFYSEYRRGQWQLGTLWFFREAKPWLVGAMIRESGNGVARLRSIEQVLLQLAQNWQQESLTSLAITPLGDPADWGEVQTLVQIYLGNLPIPVWLYEPD